MTEINFFIEGIPVGKGRPRFFRRGDFVGTYTPSKTVNWEELVRWQCRKYRPATPPLGPVMVYLNFHMPRPKSLPKKVTFHIKRPDVDNLTKAVLDGMLGSFYKDDSQIFFLGTGKIYTTERAGVEVRFLEV